MRFDRAIAIPLLALAAAALPRPALADDSIGRLAFVRGEVTVDGRPGADGARLGKDAVVETGDGKCSILLFPSRVIHLDRDTSVKLSDLENADLEHGRVRALVKAGGNNRFNIRTRTAVMGVRGTQIVVDSPRSADRGSFLTVEGAAEVTFKGQGSPPPVTVGANEQLSARLGENGAPAQAQKLEVEQVRKLSAAIAPPQHSPRTGGELAVVATKSQWNTLEPKPVTPIQLINTAQPTLPPLDPVTNLTLPGSIGGNTSVTVTFP